MPTVNRRPAAPRNPMEAFLLSTLVVAVAEIGDETQILALLLGARFKKPLPILLGIFFATLANHAVAAAAGAWLQAIVGPEALRWALGVSFIALAAWTLKPDKIDDVTMPVGVLGVFGITLVSFFLAEIGDKTQIATVGLAASFDNVTAVVAGTVGGMMVANTPAVLLGAVAIDRVPMRVVRIVAAGLFLSMGLLALTGVDITFLLGDAPNAR